MRPLLKLTFLGLTLAVSTAWADGLQALEQFLRSTQSGSTTFTQTVTSPPRQGDPVARSKTSSGTFEFSRPDRFRFQYTKPFEQLIVADGQTLWLHDIDLNQVAARKQAEVLGNTPAALIASSADLKAMLSVFTLANAPDRDGLEWVLATPRGRDAQLQSVQLGFKQGQLAALDMVDSFGQRSVLRFGDMSVNGRIAPERFRFTPPAGVDVVRQ
ncbi:MAG TPA: outer membrane lipoprotein chaperone LolA [Burkholderiaceae bacterium]|nr:outer membrane lipoprotein chaperone LolA [Burkholderiaceae bacterium]